MKILHNDALTCLHVVITRGAQNSIYTKASLPQASDLIMMDIEGFDTLKKGEATHPNILAWVAKSWTQLSDFHFHLREFILFFGMET